MQRSVPDLADIDREPEHILRQYGLRDAQGNASESDFARNCLLARRLVEKGVRFVQVFAKGAQSFSGQNGIAEQVLAETVEPNTIYTLTVEVGDQNEVALASNLLVAVVADGVELSGGTTDFLPPADGQFSTLTRSYTTSPDASGSLGIQLGELSGAFTGQVNYNNVRLTARSAQADGDDATGTESQIGNGVTPNDVPPDSELPDSDRGANRLQNFPVLAAVTEAPGGTRIEGTLQSTPDSDFRIEFFASDARDDSNHGEGRTFLDSIDVRSDVNGSVEFTADVATLPAGQPFVTATSTNISDDGAGPLNDTSEFSFVEPLGGCRFTVTNTGDAGLGTLREAITCANLTPGPHTGCNHRRQCRLV